jgi:MFS family permease
MNNKRQRLDFRAVFDPQRALLMNFTSIIGKSHLLLSITFLVAIGIGTVILGLIYFVHERYDASPGTIGLFTSTYFISYFIGCFFTRPLGKRLLPRYSIMLATGLMTVILTLILIFPGLPLAFVLIALFGGSVSLFFPPTAGWMSSGVEGKVLSKTISRWNISWSTGSILSSYIAGFLTEIDIRYPIILSIILFLFCTILVLAASLFLTNIKADRFQDAKPNTIGNKDYSTFLRFPSWLLVFTVYVMVGVIFNIFPIYAKEQLGISESRVGVLLLIEALFSTICFFILGKTVYWHFRPKLIMIFQMLLMLVLVILLSVNTFAGYALLMPIIGVIVAVTYSFSLFHGTSGSLERGKRTAVHELVQSSGIILGSIAGGQMYQVFSIKAVYLFCLTVASAGAVIQIFLLRKGTIKKRKQDSG